MELDGDLVTPRSR